MVEKFFTWLENILPNLVSAIVILIVGYIVERLVLKIMSRGLNLDRVDTTVHKFLMSIVKVVITLIVVVMALSALNVPMSSIIAAIGTAGLAIGLALQDSLSNVAGGFIILFSQPFKCGDYVKIDSSEGTVDAISILYTRLLTVENQAVFIPNGSVLKATLVNYTAEENRRLELKFSISYSDDHRKAMDIIRAVAEADEKILKEPSAPLVAMSEHQDSAVTILTRVWVKTDDYWDVRFRLIQTVKEEFDKSGITIPFNQLDVHIDNN